MRAFNLALISAVAFGLTGPAFAQTGAPVKPVAPVAKSMDAGTTTKAPVSATTEMKNGGTVATPSTATSSEAKSSAATTETIKPKVTAHKKHHAKKHVTPTSTHATTVKPLPAKT